MKKRYKTVLIITSVFFISFLGFNYYKYYNKLGNSQDSRVIKVGVYGNEPYYYIDKDNSVKGYYNDVLKVISKYDDYDYEYEVSSFKEVMEKLESGEIDIAIGANKTDERIEKFVYSSTHIAIERYGIYSNDANMKYADLKAMENLDLGVLKNGINGIYIKSIFENLKIKINHVEFNEQKNLVSDFIKGDIDLAVQPINKNIYGNLVYSFSTGPVYIIANKENKDVIQTIDKVIEENKEYIIKVLTKSYKKHFNINHITENKYNEIAIFVVLAICIAILLYIILHRNYFKRIRVQKKIRDRIKNEKYLLYYQSIFNPNIGEVTGYEALLRQKGKEGKVLPPNEFLDEIESNNMLCEVSLWVLERAIKDYNKLYKTADLEYRKYISINISMEELINDNFVKKSIELIKKYNLPKNSICFEIIERVKLDNIDKLYSGIKKLKEVGYLIAIDDFGIEYSNLDLLGKIDFDIIKLDRYFIYAISKEYIKEEILNFLSAISKRSNSVLVVEGIETEEQINLIRNIDNDKVYVQGYYYSKPKPIKK